MNLMRQVLKIRNICVWLGIDDASTEGTYTYSSDRTLIDPGIKSVIYRANGCAQTGLRNYNPGSKDCDYVYLCKGRGQTYTHVATGGGINIACEV